MKSRAHRWTIARRLVRCLVACLLLAAGRPAAPARAATALALQPASGPCALSDAAILARGTDFPPGATIVLLVGWVPEGDATFEGFTESARATVAPDGRLVAAVRLLGCGPEIPPGAQFWVQARVEGEAPLARATFTVTGAGGAAPAECFAATGFCASGRFLTYWREHGGLPLNGYPISGEFVERLEDGVEYTVQYFERARFEYHPQNPAPYDVLLGQFGRRLHPADPPIPRPTGPMIQNGFYFEATGHYVGGTFFAYWDAHGGLAQFGLPLTEEITETLEDGHPYTVQYFERARFERHPESAPPYDVLLGQFGRRILAGP